jgi:hypothetical protein
MAWEEHDAESGPFCRHFVSFDCDELCLCGHRCDAHSPSAPGECVECDCAAWRDRPEVDSAQAAGEG